MWLSELFIAIANKNSKEEVESVDDKKTDETKEDTVEVQTTKEPEKTENKQENPNVKITKDRYGNEIKITYDDNKNIIQKEYKQYGSPVVEKYDNGLLISKTVGTGESASITTYDYDENGNLMKEATKGPNQSSVTEYGGYYSNGIPKSKRTETVDKDGSTYSHYVAYAEEPYINIRGFEILQETEFEHVKDGVILNKGTCTPADKYGNYYSIHEYLYGEKCNPPKRFSNNLESD